jgi:hypothetical protein
MENNHEYDYYDQELEEALQEPLLPTEAEQLVTSVNISLWIFFIFVLLFSK